MHIGTSATTVDFSIDDLNACIPVIEGTIHDFLKAEDLITAGPVGSTATGYNTVKNTIISLLGEWNNRRQLNKANYQLDRSVAQNHIHLTTEMKIDLLGAFMVKDIDGIDVIPLYRGQNHEVI